MVLLSGLVAAIVLAPLWLDPTTFDQLRAVTSSAGLPSPTPPPAILVRPSPEPSRLTAVIARDDFSRTVSAGWGAAEFGGQYELEGQGARLSVDGVSGLVRLVAGAQGSAGLGRAIGRDVTMELNLSVGPGPARGSMDVTLLARRAADGSAYGAVLELSPSGQVTLALNLITIEGTQALAGPVLLSDVTATGGATLAVRAEFAGSDPATLRVRVWPSGRPEPDYWEAAVSDWTGALQRSGTIAIAWSSSSSADSPALLSFDNLLVTTTLLSTTTDEGTDQ
jgi:hypothetical protein